MIITRTPFRITLGGGGTDLPAYYSKYGGFIFAAAIDKFMFININVPIVDKSGEGQIFAVGDGQTPGRSPA